MNKSRILEMMRGGAADPFFAALPKDIFGGGSSAPAPDYTPMALASEEAARVSAEQADRVLAESKRQYDRNMEVAQPIIEAQTGMMKSAQQQGDEYYNYWKTKAQPVEDALNADAMASGTEAKQQEKVDRAVADSQGGYTRALNQGFRQARRYGMAPVATTGAMTVQQAANTAGAATTARDKEIALGTAKKLDVAGLYRGMPGASTGAYSSANQSGNSAVNNSTTVGNGMQAGTTAAAGLTMQGQGMKLQGIGNMLGMQTSNYNNALANDSSGLGGMLGMAKAGMDIAGAAKGLGWITSDRRLKENIKLVGKDERTGLNLYEFNYIGDGKRLRGVMADEVEAVYPDAVVYDDLGFASVNYGALGLEMVEV